MRVVEPGHVYELDNIDGEPGETQTITFVNRRLGPYGTKHSGTLNQEVLRAVVDVLSVIADRVASLDSELPWSGNAQAIKNLVDAQRLLRVTILLHEQRAAERKIDKAGYRPEETPVGSDGHFKL